MSYFVGVASVSQLKMEYRRLAAKYHPDRGGDSRQMQEINAYYEHIRTKLKAKERAEKNKVKAPKTSKRTAASGYEHKPSRRPSHQKTDSESLDFQNVSVGETVFVNGTEGEVTEVSDLSFRVVAKGRPRQAIFNKIGGKGKYNQRLNASYDNRHKKRGFSAVV